MARDGTHTRSPGEEFRIASQMEIVRDLSGRLLQVQDEERREIARALHNSVGQIVTGLSMNLSIQLRGCSGLSPKAIAAVTDSSDLLKRLSRGMRTISPLLLPRFSTKSDSP